MNKGYYKVKKPENERIIDFCNEKEEAEKLKEAIEEIKIKKIEIPLIIGGKEIKWNSNNRFFSFCIFIFNNLKTKYNR